MKKYGINYTIKVEQFDKKYTLYSATILTTDPIFPSFEMDWKHIKDLNFHSSTLNENVAHNVNTKLNSIQIIQDNITIL